MAAPMTGATPTGGASGATDGKTRSVLLLVFAVFFILGGVTNIIDVILPKLKGLYDLNHTQANLINFAFFTAYALFSIPSGIIMSKLGYIRGFVLGFGMIAVASLMFIPAANSGIYASFLGAMFLIGAGITLLQVGMNPVTMALGPNETAHSRLMFGQMFNSIGVVIMVAGGAQLLLGKGSGVDPKTLSGDALTAFRIAEAQEISQAYVGLAIAMTLIAALFWFWRSALDGQKAEEVKTEGTLALFLSNRRLQFGALCIFTYVGAEVAIGSNLISYLGDSGKMGLSQADAKWYVPLYWSSAFIGRFIGAFLLRVVAPAKVLLTFATVALLLVLVSSVSSGAISGWTLVLVGLFNSVMFPTIFSLTTQGMTDEAPQASGIMCTAIVGGAIVPVLFGAAADLTGLSLALIVPAICYAIIASFGLWNAKQAAA
jgi:MFS transporter, FHS family, L-fucose permease